MVYGELVFFENRGRVLVLNSIFQGSIRVRYGFGRQGLGLAGVHRFGICGVSGVWGLVVGGFEVSAWDLGSFGRSLAGRTKGSFSRSASCLVFTKRVVYSFVSSWLSVRCAGLFKRFASVDRTFSRN